MRTPAGFSREGDGGCASLVWPGNLESAIGKPLSRFGKSP
jgi:hypothetical protein